MTKDLIEAYLYMPNQGSCKLMLSLAWLSRTRDDSPKIDKKNEKTFPQPKGGTFLEIPILEIQHIQNRNQQFIKGLKRYGDCAFRLKIVH